jgi:Cupin-like domain
MAIMREIVQGKPDAATAFHSHSISMPAVAELLIRGEPLEAIRAQLCGSDSLPLRDYAESIQREVSFSLAVERERMVKRLEGLLNLYSALWRQSQDARLLRVVDKMDEDEFRDDFYCRNRAVLIRNGAASWRATTLWTPQYFSERYGFAAVEYFQGPRYSDSPLRSTTTLREFVEMMNSCTTPNAFYMVANNRTMTASRLRPLIDDIGDVSWLSRFKEFKDAAQLWMGPYGTITDLHHDIANNLFVQIYGRKEFLLTPAFEYPKLHGEGVYSNAQTIVPGQPPTPVLDVQWLRIVVKPGDILFIPAGWWHWVHAIDSSISINVNFCLGSGHDQWDAALV